MAKLEGLVAALLNEREIVINLGGSSGVVSGMIFSVREQPITVVDPKTKVELGRISREKIKVKAEKVEPNFAIARTFETYTAFVGGEGGFAIRIPSFQPGREVTKVRTLRASERSEFDPLDEHSSLVKVGDPVVLIEDPREATTPKQAKAVTPVRAEGA